MKKDEQIPEFVDKRKFLPGRPPTVPKRFRPLFWEDQDQRNGTIRAIRRRCRELKEHTGADSAQKDLLVQRATFISLQLETMEIETVATGEPFDSGRYAQMSNALLGILKTLGLNRHVRDVTDLKDYLKRRQK